MLIARKAYWSADLEPELDERSIGEILAELATTAGDDLAVLWEVGDDLRSLTWSQLYAVATRGATWLVARTSPGDRVAVWAPNSLVWFILEYASALAGTVLAPLNPALVDPEAEYLLSHSGAALLFTVPDSAGKPLLERATDLHPRLPQLRDIVELEPWGAALLAQPAPGPGPDDPTPTLPVVRPEDPFLVQFTSGTTGRPKGAVITHLAAFNSARYSALALEPSDHEVWCTALPLHHVGGSISLVLGALAVRGTYVVVPRPTAGDVLRLLVRTRATHTGFVATVLQRLIDNPDFPSADLSSLRTMMGGGASVPSALIRELEKILGATVLIGYGQSESVSISQTGLHDSSDDKATTIGRPLPQREVCIQRLGTRVEGSAGEIAELGEVGELCTRSRLTMTGYMDGLATDDEVFDTEGWMHTGDLAAMDDRGLITFHGRAREVIIRGGENIYPREVEEALLGHPGIAEIAVVGTPDPTWGEQVAAFVRPADGARLDDQELRGYARQVLAPFKVPVIWRVVESFPMTASQKIRKNVLRDQLTASSDAPLGG
ncbi:AMP-dependent synthetase and ligase [Frankia canadensis]|uniref:AMP-dependent synthetase and ligase n=1 Tax=Frankia canadensis TaxID=1836972 RepID=A0A2I2L2V2_9ACTN|nr:class I adenylate-forming enzyme family protein [Frankia canadensis]SNQ52228.1 AMP-dependent synthetase and ligase [Frankia canadensis]SOU59518.1 AMP-dependent synthetase and ligase [Frankia canadensis]